MTTNENPNIKYLNEERKKHGAMPYVGAFNRDIEKSMKILNHNLGNDNNESSSDNSSASGECSGACESLDELNPMTNKQIREALKVMDSKSINEDTEFYDLLTMFEAIIPNKPFNNEETQAMTAAIRSKNPLTVKSTLQGIEAQRAANRGIPYKPDDKVNVGNSNIQANVKEGLDEDDLNSIYEEELELNEGRDNLIPQKCVSIETHTTYWSPWDTKKKDYAKFGIRYRYDDRQSCLDAINDPDNDLGYGPTKDKDNNNDNSEDNNEREFTEITPVKKSKDKELLAASYDNHFENSVTINESVMLHIDGEDADADREFPNVRLAQKAAEESGKDWEIYNVNEVNGEHIHIDSSKDDDISPKVKPIVNVCPRLDDELTELALAIGNPDVIDAYNHGIIIRKPAAQYSSHKGDLFRDIWILVKLYEHSNGGDETIGVSKDDLDKFTGTPRNSQGVSGNQTYYDDFTRDIPPLVKYGHYTSNGKFFPSYQGSGSNYYQELVYPTSELKKFIETDQGIFSRGKPVMKKGKQLTINIKRDFLDVPAIYDKFNPEALPERDAQADMTQRQHSQEIRQGKANAQTNGKKMNPQYPSVNPQNSTPATANAAPQPSPAPTQTPKPVSNAMPQQAPKPEVKIEPEVKPEVKPEPEAPKQDKSAALKAARARMKARMGLQTESLEEDVKNEEFKTTEVLQEPVDFSAPSGNKSMFEKEYKIWKGLDEAAEITDDDYDENTLKCMCCKHSWCFDDAKRDIWGK